MLNKKIKLALIFLVLIITFLLVYSPHFNYKYPLHADEWHHVENAERILDGNYDYKAPNYEIGYDFIIAGFFAILKIFKINTIMAYSFFPAIFAIIASLLLFIFVRKIAGFNVALLSMIFFASLPSNINILGLWFAIPLTMAIPFIFLFLNLFVNGFESKKRFYYCIPILLLLFLIHPPSALIVISISFIYCFFARDIKKNWLPLILIFLVPLLALILSSFTVPIKLTFYNLVFKHGYTVYEPSLELYSLKLAVGKNVLAINRYFVPLIYGIIPFLLALVGIYFVYKEE
ncbi:hypothetical protein HZA33_05480, partial [Candidatus Pacearchaeota archaeon]|nr:hypothetical protein [Candidatus Pacearchaeota archaeon]